MPLPAEQPPQRLLEKGEVERLNFPPGPAHHVEARVRRQSNFAGVSAGVIAGTRGEVRGSPGPTPVHDSFLELLRALHVLFYPTAAGSGPASSLVRVISTPRPRRSP